MLFKIKNKYQAEEPGAESGTGSGEPVTTESPEGETTPPDDSSVKPAEGETEGKPGETKPGADEGGKAETYDKLEMPEGMEVDQDLFDTFAPMMKDANMTQEQAQLFASTMAQQVLKQEEKQRVDFDQQVKDWGDEAKADKEYGGDSYEESSSLAIKAVETFGTPELKNLLNEYGIGNHPEMVRFMYRVGKATAEDNPGEGGESLAPKGDYASILYPEK